MPEIAEYPLQKNNTENTRIRDIEEKISLLKDRVLLIGNTHIEEREKTFQDIQEIKKVIIQVVEENKRIKEILQRLTEIINTTARKEDLLILQRQFDIFRK